METNALILIFLIIDLNRVAGKEVPKPDQLEVKILDGEVLVHWKHPVDAPKNPRYNVEMGRYSGKWDMVPGCSGINRTYCDLSGCIDDYRTAYKVRVQLIAGDKLSAWTTPQRKKILPNDSELRPPSFTLLATSSTLTVYVHSKPVFKELFPFGLIYTIYLEERGEHNKTTTAYLTDDMDEDQRTKIFTSLQWGKEYCISIQVEGSGGSFRSSLSPTKCLQLPEQEWFIMAVSSLSILGVLAVIAIMAAFLMCHLKRPEKTPPALKSPVSGWLPLSVGDGRMELVTDKGWFLSSYTTEVKNCLKVPETHFTAMEDCEEDRRDSINSGVSIESNSANERRRLVRQEDSGCGSMGGHESSTGSPTEYSSEDERTDVHTGRKREDSGVGLGCKLGSINLGEKNSVAGGNYHSQRPSAVQICVCDDKEMLQQVQPDSSLAEVVTGYRAGPQLCICSGAGWCTWCHKHRLYGSDAIDQKTTVCTENELLPSQCDSVNFHCGNITFSDYTRKTQTNIVVMDDLDTTFIQLRNTFPLLTCMPTLPPIKFGQDYNMNNTTLSLCDVQLLAD